MEGRVELVILEGEILISYAPAITVNPRMCRCVEAGESFMVNESDKVSLTQQEGNS